MTIVKKLKEKVLAGEEITREEAIELSKASFEELTSAANEIRERMCGQVFDMCTIINGKCGKCSEDCKYCAQSAHYNTNLSDSYGLLDTQEILRQAKHNDDRGVLRYSIVTSGKRLSDEEVDKVCESIRRIRKETGIQVCVSFGLLDEELFRKIKEAGAS